MRLGSICTCYDIPVCLKPSSNGSVSQVCWPILSNNMPASAQHVAFAVDAPVSHVSTGRPVKRVSRQRNLSTHDTPSVVWPYSADGFDRGQTRMRRSIFCLASGFVSSLYGYYLSCRLDTEIYRFHFKLSNKTLQLQFGCNCAQMKCKHTAADPEPHGKLFSFYAFLSAAKAWEEWAQLPE